MTGRDNLHPSSASWCDIPEEAALLLDRYLESLERGDAMDLEAWLAAHAPWEDVLRPAAQQILRLRQFVAGTPSVGKSEETHQVLSWSHFNDFKIESILGRGGMATVYLAHDTALNRQVALKVLPNTVEGAEERRVRFQIEALATAKLVHPNIAPVFSIGEHAGTHYYTMHYIEGLTMSDWIAEYQQRAGLTLAPTLESGTPRVSDVPAANDLAIQPKIGLDEFWDQSWSTDVNSVDYDRNVARIVLVAARALDFAHRQQVVHRDIKPGNIMLDRFGHVWITDFGLAQLNGGNDPNLGNRVGTLRYMSPEQRKGKTPADARSDIYSLGITLDELISLRVDSTGHNNSDSVVRRAGGPLRKKRLARKVPAPLDAIAKKASAIDPDRRYQTMATFAHDLERFLLTGGAPARKVGGPFRMGTAVAVGAVVLTAAFLVGRRSVDEGRHVDAPSDATSLTVQGPIGRPSATISSLTSSDAERLSLRWGFPDELAGRTLDPTFGQAGVCVASLSYGTDCPVDALTDASDNIVIGYIPDPIGPGLKGWGLAIMKEDGSDTMPYARQYGGTHSRQGVQKIARQSDGRIVCAGTYKFSYALSRQLSDGTLEWETEPIDFPHGLYGHTTAVVIAKDPESDAVRYVIGGGVSKGQQSYIRTLVAYRDDGSLDRTFGVGGMVIFDDAFTRTEDMIQLADGRLVVTGSIDAKTLSSKGTLSLQCFGPRGDVQYNCQHRLGMAEHWHVTGMVLCASPQQRHVVIAGIRSSQQEAATLFVSRFATEDGSLDPTFGNHGMHVVDLGNGDATPLGIALDETGTIYIAGMVVDAHQACQAAMVVLSPDGKQLLMSTLANPGTTARSIVIDQKGRMVVMGQVESDTILLRYGPR